MKCLKCGAEAPPCLTSSLCPACMGSPSAATSASNPLAGCLTVLSIVLLIAGFVLFHGCSEKEASVQHPPEVNQTVPAVAYVPQKILAEARAEFAAKDYDATVSTLEQLKPSDLKERQAASLYSRASTLAAKEAAEVARTARLTYATTYERGLLEAGMDATVRSEGKNADTLVITYILMNRPLVFQMINDSETMTVWATYGFKKVRFSDGYESSWTQTIP